MKNHNPVVGSYPPFIHDWRTSAKASWICALTLMPVVAWSSALYGRLAIEVWVAALASALVSEILASGLLKRWTLSDGSAVVTGLLVACAMPAGVPLYIPVVSAAFAVLVVKAAFGGLGANWMNPALAGIAFAYANWPAEMRDYLLPRIVSGVDGVSAVTPLAFARGLVGGGSGRVMDALHGAGYPLSGFDSSITGFLNDAIFSRIGARLPDGYIDLAIGFKPGAIGESAMLAVLVGSIILIALRLVKTEIPAAMLGVFVLLVRVFGTGLPGEEMFSGDVMYALAGGSVLLAAFYMATDPVSSPVGFKAGILYGAAIGVLCFIFRRWGAFTESVTFAVLAMNVITPFIEKVASSIVNARRKPRVA